MRQTAEQKRWALVLADPQSPPELRAEARSHLGITADPSPQHQYTAALDSVVESYWHKRREELEQRDPIAERTYLALASLIFLGGSPATVNADAEIIVAAFSACRSTWMRRKAGRALLAILVLNGDSISINLRNRLEAALGSITDFDVHRPEERDLLEVLCIAKEHETETANTQNIKP